MQMAWYLTIILINKAGTQPPPPPQQALTVYYMLFLNTIFVKEF